MRSVPVNTGKAYHVLISRGLLNETGTRLAALTPSSFTALVADDTVDGLYGDRVETSLREAGFRVARTRFPQGEISKTLATYGKIMNFLAENRLTRRDTLVALGGGVTGDLAGFAAATYLRGINVLQIPTPLLAMVDSSVGGKTGVDLPAGKNLVGAFHQPVGVLCDPNALDTLTPEGFADGTGEVLKYGVLCDAALFDKLAGGNWRDDVEAVIERCVQIKAEVCAADEREAGQRQLLNLGHTFGHAIERCSGYTLPHGHAVGVGMLYAAKIAASLGLCGVDCVQRIREALRNNGLPTAAHYPPEALANAALSDKKRAGDRITLVLPNRIGACERVPVPVEQLEQLANAAVKTE